MTDTARRVPGTEWPPLVLLGLIALGLPRTILADLGIVEPEGSWVYYVLALAPFAVWFAVAGMRRTGRPVRDHLVAGLAYGLSLILVHESLSAVGASQGNYPPPSAVDFAEQFSSPMRGIALHGFTSAIALAIGLGVGALAAVTAVVSNRVRRRDHSRQ